MEIPYPSVAQLSSIIQQVVRVDAVTPNLQPELISTFERVVKPDGSPLEPEQVGKLRYPYCSLVVSPPVSPKNSVEQGRIEWESRTLLAWSYPGATYEQLPIDSIMGVFSRLCSRLVPRSYKVIESKIGAEQIDGSNVWFLLLEILWQYHTPITECAVVEPTQPESWSHEIPQYSPTEFNIGLWRSLIPLNPDTSTRDPYID